MSIVESRDQMLEVGKLSKIPLESFYFAFWAFHALLSRLVVFGSRNIVAHYVFESIYRHLCFGFLFCSDFSERTLIGSSTVDFQTQLVSSNHPSNLHLHGTDKSIFEFAAKTTITARIQDGGL